MLINRQRGRESGQTLVVAALVMAVVMGFTALAIDVGLFLEERRDNQNDADAMALAGVQYLPENPDMARKTARDWGLKNGVASTDIVKVEVKST
ncbi:MAG TPA: pilus assembly protein TadG-related protein, partial [Dehalococcoidia bacterium]|nr:pilus assembly protein TadG-related protein [Dehalococcoidia bacterium]